MKRAAAVRAQDDQFTDKLNAEGEWQQLVASFQKDPPAEPVRSNLLRELP